MVNLYNLPEEDKILIANKLIEHYYNVNVLKKICPYLLRRELVVLSKFDRKHNTRMLKCSNYKNLQFILFELLKMDKKKKGYVLYYSLAKYVYGIPYQSSDLNNRDNSKWLINHHEFIQEFDLLIDIDAPSLDYINEALSDLKSIINYFDKNKIPYILRFSGCGFHIIIPSRYFANLFEDEKIFIPTYENNIYNIHYNIALALYHKFSNFVDTGIYESRRVTKCPYSLSYYDKNNINICYPMNKKDIENFNLENYNIIINPYIDFSRVDEINNYEGSIVPLLSFANIKKGDYKNDKS